MQKLFCLNEANTSRTPIAGFLIILGGTIEARERLFVQTAEGFINRFNIDIRLQSEVLSVSPKDKTIKVKNLKTGEDYTASYDKLIISTGAEPLKLPLPGIGRPGKQTGQNRCRQYFRGKQSCLRRHNRDIHSQSF